MPNLVDLTGQTFGRLKVTSRAPEPGKRVKWICVCECGTQKAVSGTSLVQGGTSSCGCLRNERVTKANLARAKHGQARGHKPSPEWRSWKSMIDRCTLPSMPNYHLYGGRGITVCDQWRGKDGFAQFYADLGPRPVGCTLDRIATDGNYEPGNCRWATASEQASNRRQTPEYQAQMKANLDAGRARVWGDPEVKAKMLESRRRKRRQT
jgi:hypothetical protein